MHDNTTFIGVLGTTAAIGSAAVTKLSELDLWMKIGINAFGLLAGLLTVTYLMLKLWHGTYKKP